jgi:NADH-quinone oxidoreductase subunit F
VRRSEAGSDELDELRKRIATVVDGARCSLATQQQTVVASLLDRFPDDVNAHLDGKTPASEPELVAELVDIDDGVARIDEHHFAKQPDWTYDATDSGKSPAERLGEHREPEQLDD